MATMIKFCSINRTNICCSGYQWNTEQDKCIRKYKYLKIIDKTYMPCSQSIFFHRSNKEFQFNVFAVCDKGYNGIHCDHRCVAPYYGFDCQLECECIKEDCHHAEGCKQTYKTGILTDYLCMMYTLCIEFVDFYGLYKYVIRNPYVIIQVQY